ncbi:MAG: hypothetical protein OXC63_13680 [Aestuariivita sp.]|nr:hypothetical protein [Aestuariivita sp.]MCY4347186.1 hypothetical protein [Aestuariivita sp.]
MTGAEVTAETCMRINHEGTSDSCETGKGGLSIRASRQPFDRPDMIFSAGIEISSVRLRLMREVRYSILAL